jgi:hypothetical protein
VILVLEQMAKDGGTTFERALLLDETRNRYALFSIGWQGVSRVHTCLVHIDLIGNKVWVQEDVTKAGISNRLVATGIPPHHIVLGFYAPEERLHTEFAVN